MRIPKPGMQYRQFGIARRYVVEGCVTAKINGVWEENGMVLYREKGGERWFARQREEFLETFEEVPAWWQQGGGAAAPAGRGEGERNAEGGNTKQGTLGAEGLKGLELRLEPLTAARARELAQEAETARVEGKMRLVLEGVLEAVERAARRGERTVRVLWEEVQDGPRFAPEVIAFTGSELALRGFAMQVLGAPGEPRSVGLIVGW